MFAFATQGSHNKANLKVNLKQQLTARTARKCVYITVRYWSTKYSTEQF